MWSVCKDVFGCLCNVCASLSVGGVALKIGNRREMRNSVSGGALCG